MNEKFNKNAKVEKLTKKVGRGVRLIVIGPLAMPPFVLVEHENTKVAHGSGVEDEWRRVFCKRKSLYVV